MGDAKNRTQTKEAQKTILWIRFIAGAPINAFTKSVKYFEIKISRTNSILFTQDTDNGSFRPKSILTLVFLNILISKYLTDFVKSLIVPSSFLLYSLYTPKRVMIAEHIHIISSLYPDNTVSGEETLQWSRAVGDAVTDKTGL